MSKIERVCEALGLDVQMHACGPAHRAVIAATRNTHFYEMALIGPGLGVRYDWEFIERHRNALFAFGKEA